MMPEYKFLIIEDNEDDYILITRFLKHEGFNFEHKRVENSLDLELTLDEGPWDLFISDFNMRDFNGLKALQICLQMSPLSPFVLVSGAIGEEAAVDIMKAGARDYVKKGNLSRLAVVVKGLLLEREQRLKLAAMEKEIKQSETNYRMIFESATNLILTIDERGFIIDCNKRISNMGYTKQGVINHHISRLIHPDYLEGAEIHLMMVMDKGYSNGYECKMRRRDGKSIDTRVDSSAIYDDKGYFLRAICIIDDVTRRNLALEALFISEERFRQMAESIQEVFWLQDASTGNILYVNPYYEKLYGESSSYLVEKPDSWQKFIHPEDKERVINKANTRKDQFNNKAVTEIVDEYRIIQAGGHTRWVRSKVFPIQNEEGQLIRYAGIASDITEYKSASQEADFHREQLIRAEKMASLGTLISGITHEINNPNNFIMLNAQVFSEAWKNIKAILDEYLEENGDFSLGKLPYSEARDQIKGLIDGIFEGSQRIKKIVESLKHYARKQVGDEKCPADINIIVESSIYIIDSLIKKATDNFILNLGQGLPQISCRPQQLEQVFINLITNACHALTNKTQKLEIITTCNKDKIIIKVIDEGCGIPQKELQNIMDPFFTTKRETGGTGLGLYISYNILESHNGTINYESIPGKGTCVTITLPLTPGDTQ